MNHRVHEEAEEALLSWWLDELDEAGAAEVEEHLFECDECAARLSRIVRLGGAIRRSLREGRIATAVTPAFVERLRADGLRLREYRPEAGGSVYCTIAPEDDLVISRLRASLEGVRQLDLEIDAQGQTYRLPHVAFDPASAEVTYIPPAATLRTLGASTHRMRLLAVTPGEERLIGEFTFNHEPWGARPSDEQV
jgi:hypothetical protein